MNNLGRNIKVDQEKEACHVTNAARSRTPPRSFLHSWCWTSQSSNCWITSLYSMAVSCQTLWIIIWNYQLVKESGTRILTGGVNILQKNISYQISIGHVHQYVIQSDYEIHPKVYQGLDRRLINNSSKWIHNNVKHYQAFPTQD